MVILWLLDFSYQYFSFIITYHIIHFHQKEIKKIILHARKLCRLGIKLKLSKKIMWLIIGKIVFMDLILLLTCVYTSVKNLEILEFCFIFSIIMTFITTFVQDLKCCGFLFASSFLNSLNEKISRGINMDIKSDFFKKDARCD
jgi:hypothetical protein